jgi:hypothetical protein
MIPIRLSGAWTPPPLTSARRLPGSATPSSSWSGSGPRSPCSGSGSCGLAGGAGRCRTPWFYRLVVVAGPASLVALIAGWIVTEVGRQPWIVYELMRVDEAVSGAEGIPVGYATLALVYLGLIGTALYMLRRLARHPPEVEAQPGPGDIEVLP